MVKDSILTPPKKIKPRRVRTSADRPEILWKRLSPQNLIAKLQPTFAPRIAFFSIMKEQSKFERVTIQKRCLTTSSIMSCGYYNQVTSPCLSLSLVLLLLTLENHTSDYDLTLGYSCATKQNPRSIMAGTGGTKDRNPRPHPPNRG